MYRAVQPSLILRRFLIDLSPIAEYRQPHIDSYHAEDFCVAFTVVVKQNPCKLAHVRPSTELHVISALATLRRNYRLSRPQKASTLSKFWGEFRP